MPDEAVAFEEMVLRVDVRDRRVRPRRAFAAHEQADDLNNLVSLCASCHSGTSADAERKWLRGDVIGQRRYERVVGL